MTSFAVVITSYNYRDFVGAAIDSALAQTRAAAQIIVVDDGSTDGSPDYLREHYGSDARVTLLCGENGGQLVAFQRGVAEARAMYPALDVVEEDPAADRRLLEGIADWCDRYTPMVALDGKDGLFLDITGCAHLFGGEAALLGDILSRLFHMGLDARAAVSSSPGLS